MELMDIIVIPENGSWKGTLEELETALTKSFTAREPTVIEALVEISDLGTEST